MTKEEKSLWKELADLTFTKCKQHCHKLGSCCEDSYCNAAIDYANDKGIDLVKKLGQFPFIGNNGICKVPPYLRPMCKISSLGYDPSDPEWTDKYFELRDKCDQTLT